MSSSPRDRRKGPINIVLGAILLLIGLIGLAAGMVAWAAAAFILLGLVLGLGGVAQAREYRNGRKG